MQYIDNSVYDSSYGELQDLQQAQIAALRAFYSDETPLPVVETEWLFDSDESEVVITNENLAEICEWLRSSKVWFGFKFSVVEDERGLVLVF